MYVLLRLIVPELHPISFPPSPNEDQSVQVASPVSGEDLNFDEEVAVDEVVEVETLRSRIRNTQESGQDSSFVEMDDILGVDGSLEMSVRDFPQVIEPEQNLADTIQGNRAEINLADAAQVRESEFQVLTDGH